MVSRIIGLVAVIAIIILFASGAINVNSFKDAADWTKDQVSNKITNVQTERIDSNHMRVEFIMEIPDDTQQKVLKDEKSE